MDDRKHAAYRKMLLNVAEDISDSFLENMKFRCDHIVKGREKEQITSAIQLWTALEKREYLGPNNVDFLKELLRSCTRGQVNELRIVQQYENDFIHTAENNQNNAYRHQQQQQQQQQHRHHRYPHYSSINGTNPQQIIYIVQNDTGNETGRHFNRHDSQTVCHEHEQYNGPDLQREINFLSRSLGKHWRFFIRSLGVNELVIEDATCDYRTMREQIQQCLHHWLNQERNNASRPKLVAGLRQVQRNDLASAMEEGQF